MSFFFIFSLDHHRMPALRAKPFLDFESFLEEPSHKSSFHSLSLNIHKANNSIPFHLRYQVNSMNSFVFSSHFVFRLVDKFGNYQYLARCLQWRILSVYFNTVTWSRAASDWSWPVHFQISFRSAWIQNPSWKKRCYFERVKVR